MIKKTIPLAIVTAVMIVGTELVLHLDSGTTYDIKYALIPAIGGLVILAVIYRYPSVKIMLSMFFLTELVKYLITGQSVINALVNNNIITIIMLVIPLILSLNLAICYFDTAEEDHSTSILLLVAGLGISAIILVIASIHSFITTENVMLATRDLSLGVLMAVAISFIVILLFVEENYESEPWRAVHAPPRAFETTVIPPEPDFEPEPEPIAIPKTSN